MRIVDARLDPYELPFVRLVRTARASWRTRSGIVLTLCDEAGRRGVGEAAPLPGYSTESLALVERKLDEAIRAVIGRPIADTPQAISDALQNVRLPASVRHAVDQALLDLVGRRKGVSVARLLAPEPLTVREVVPVQRLVHDEDTAHHAVEAGYRTVKLKVGMDGIDGLADDVALLRQVRAAVGPDVEVRVDANGAYSAKEAIRAIGKFAASDIACIEQPCDATDLSGMAKVVRSVDTPVAADESVRSLADLDALLAAEAADVIVIKPMLVGGLQPSIAMGHRAAEAGLPVYVTTAFEAAVGRSGALHVAAAMPGTLWACGLDTGSLLLRDVGPGPMIDAGQATLRADAGIGVRLHG